MPSPKQPEKGKRDYYQARYRGNVGPCTGVDKSGDPSTLADTALVQGINITIRDGTISERGGQSKVNPDEAMSGCVVGMIEVNGAGEDDPDLLLISPLGSLVASGLGAIDSWVASSDTYTRLTEGATGDAGIGVYGCPVSSGSGVANSTTSRFSITRWNGDVVLLGAMLSDATYATFGVFKVVPDPDEAHPEKFKIQEIVSLPALIGGGTPVPASLVAIPAPPQANEVGEYLFIGTLGGGVIGTNGAQVFTSLAEGTFTGRVIVFRYHDTVYACGNQELQRLTPGTTATWTNIGLPGAAFPAGVIAFRPTCAVEYDNKCYLGGWDQNEVYGGCILSITESTAGVITVAVAHVPVIDVSGTPRVCNHIIDMCSLQDGILYAYSANASALGTNNIIWIGTYAGASWTDEAAVVSGTEANPALLWRLYSTGTAAFAGAISTIESSAVGFTDAGVLRVRTVTFDGALDDGIYIDRINNTFVLMTDSYGSSDIIAL